MECNRDEAIRAKAIAENKLADKDFAGAKKFTLKAQSLYPELDGISQILIALNVYISSENKINGESDWYGVLDVKPSDDEETIRKQYRKLALMLHPDKNKSVGADGAFKILSEAWSLLSDKAKRSAYNQRRNSRGLHQKVNLSSQSGRSSTSPNVNNGVHKASSKPKNWNGASGTTTRPGSGAVPNRAPSPTPPPPPQPPAATVLHGGDTFWTVCRQCKMHYEYMRVYVNRTLLCPTCQKAFLAVEMAPPTNFPMGGQAQSCGGDESLKNGSGDGGSRIKVDVKGGNGRKKREGEQTSKRRKGECEGQSKTKMGSSSSARNGGGKRNAIKKNEGI